MNLPQPALPTFLVKLLSIKKKVKYRSLLIKEEKILLVAKESGESEDIMNAMGDVISACTFGKIEAYKLPLFDFVKLYIAIKAQSSGSEMELQYICKQKVGEDNHVCNHVSNVLIDLNDVEIKGKIKDGKVNLDKDIGVNLIYPNIDILMEQSNDKLEVIANCIDYVWDDKTVYHSKDLKLKDKINWLEGLNSDMLRGVKEYFDSVPEVGLDTKFKCKSCGYEKDINLRGLDDFFA